MTRGLPFGAVLLLLSATVAAADPISLKVASASVETMPGNPPALSIVLAPESAADFAAFTTANVGRTVVISSGATTLLTARLIDPITGGMIMVSGDFQRAELTAIAATLSAGGPVKADVQTP